MNDFPFNLDDLESLALFVAVIVPGSGGAKSAVGGPAPAPAGTGILQEGSGSNFILQEDAFFIIQES